MCQFFIDNWDKFTMILLSVVAIAIAILSSRQTSKDATKQIERIKELESLQAEIALIQLDKELWEINNRWIRNSKQIGDVLDDQHSFITQYSDFAYSKAHELNKIEKNLKYEQEFYDLQKKRLAYYIKRVEELKKKLNLE